MSLDFFRRQAQPGRIDHRRVSLPLQLQRQVSDNNFGAGISIQARIGNKDFQLAMVVGLA
jgi:hypothetical protein